MTDRHAGYLVTLADDVREDDAEAVINALRMVKGVVRVEPVPANIDQSIARTRRDSEWATRISEVAQELMRR